MERELTSSFLPIAIQVFVTSHDTRGHSCNFGISLSVGIIIIYDANGNVDVLKKLSQLLCLKAFNLLPIRGFIIII
jgi:hypothetical protein